MDWVDFFLREVWEYVFWDSGVWVFWEGWDFLGVRPRRRFLKGSEVLLGMEPRPGGGIELELEGWVSCSSFSGAERWERNK